MAVTTSQVFATMARLYTLLHDETAFTAHPQSGEVPLVVFGGIVNEETREPVVISGAPPDAPQLDFAVLGVVGIDEVFGVRIEIASTVPGQTGAVVLARLGAITATIETALRSQTTGRPAGINIAPVLWHHVARILPNLYLGAEGVEGHCSIDILFRARI